MIELLFTTTKPNISSYKHKNRKNNMNNYYYNEKQPQNNFWGEIYGDSLLMGLRQIRLHLLEHSRQISTYLAEWLRQISSYLSEGYQ